MEQSSARKGVRVKFKEERKNRKIGTATIFEILENSGNSGATILNCATKGLRLDF